MQSYLRQATAAQSRSIGPFIDDTDFKTVLTGLTINNTDILLSVDGGASAAKNAGGGTHRMNGIYGITFDATDTATVGELEVSVLVAGALVVFATFVVLEEAVYDMLFAASAPGYNAAAVVASVTGNVGGNVVGAVASVVGNVGGNVGGNVTGSVGSVAAGGITAASIATGAIDADALAADAVAEIADAVWDEPLAGHVAAGSTGEALNDASSGTDPATLAAAVWDEPLAGHVAAGSTGEALNAAGSAGDPWTTALPGAYTAGQAGYILGNGVPVDAAALVDIADAVWDEPMAGHVGVGTAGALLTDAADEDAPETIATAVWDLADGIESGWTPRQTLRVIAAAEGGKVSGADANAPIFRSLDDTKNRIAAATDAYGNRLAITYDKT